MCEANTATSRTVSHRRQASTITAMVTVRSPDADAGLTQGQQRERGHDADQVHHGFNRSKTTAPVATA